MVKLRQLIGRIGETYDRPLGMSSETQQLLRQAGPAEREALLGVPIRYVDERGPLR